MIITSKSNQTVKTLVKLSDKKYRKELNMYLVEGTKPVSECIAAGIKPEFIVCTEEYAKLYPNSVILARGLFVSVSSEKNPQGVIAAVKLPDTSVESPQGNALLLDCLQDPGNLGTIIRTANAAGIRDIYLSGCTDPFSPKAVRASMSGIFFVRLHIGTRQQILGALAGVSLISADMDGENVFDFQPPERYCLCIGNEGNGICSELLTASNYKISIPMESTCESLNAAVSAGIAMYILKNKAVSDGKV